MLQQGNKKNHIICLGYLSLGLPTLYLTLNIDKSQIKLTKLKMNLHIIVALTLHWISIKELN